MVLLNRIKLYDMVTTFLNSDNFKHKVFEINQTCSKINIADVFNDRKGSYLNEFTLFLAHFNVIPNFVHEINIDCKKANQAWNR
jgi:hypothetical protein